MMMKRSIFAAATLMTATAAMAAPPEERAAGEAPTATAAADSEPEPAEEKKICRTERATGSLTRRTRVCMTAEQWREVNSRTMRGVSDMQGQGSGGQVVQNNGGAGG